MQELAVEKAVIVKTNLWHRFDDANSWFFEKNALIFTLLEKHLLEVNETCGLPFTQGVMKCIKNKFGLKSAALQNSFLFW